MLAFEVFYFFMFNSSLTLKEDINNEKIFSRKTKNINIILSIPTVGFY